MAVYIQPGSVRPDGSLRKPIRVRQAAPRYQPPSQRPPSSSGTARSPSPGKLPARSIMSYGVPFLYVGITVSVNDAFVKSWLSRFPGIQTSPFPFSSKNVWPQDLAIAGWLMVDNKADSSSELDEDLLSNLLSWFSTWVVGQESPFSAGNHFRESVTASAQLLFDPRLSRHARACVHRLARDVPLNLNNPLESSSTGQGPDRFIAVSIFDQIYGPTISSSSAFTKKPPTNEERSTIKYVQSGCEMAGEDAPGASELLDMLRVPIPGLGHEQGGGGAAVGDSASRLAVSSPRLHSRLVEQQRRVGVVRVLLTAAATGDRESLERIAVEDRWAIFFSGQGNLQHLCKDFHAPVLAKTADRVDDPFLRAATAERTKEGGRALSGMYSAVHPAVTIVLASVSTAGTTAVADGTAAVICNKQVPEGEKEGDCSPLSLAVSNGHVACAQLLISHGVPSQSFSRYHSMGMRQVAAVLCPEKKRIAMSALFAPPADVSPPPIEPGGHAFVSEMS